MDTLYQRLRASLLEQHKREIEELDAKFGIQPALITHKPQPFKARHGKRRSGPMNVITPAILRTLKNFNGQPFTTNAMMDALKKIDAQVWYRLKEHGSAAANLCTLVKKGYLRAHNDSDSTRWWTAIGTHSPKEKPNAPIS